MMLTARKAPRACQSCRLHLWSIFENGFTTIKAVKASHRAPYPTTVRPRTRASTVRPTAPTRHFSTSVGLSDGSKPLQDSIPADERNLEEDGISADGALPGELEAVVRQARQTFGETLPKNYLSADEYTLYERLYGPPLRETQADDLEYTAGEEELEEPRNVLLRENAEGEYEEVEMDPEIPFSYAVTQDGAALEAGVVEASTDQDLLGDMVDGEMHEGEEAIEGSTNLDVEDVEGLEYVNSGDSVEPMGRNRREIDAIARLHRDVAEAQAAQNALSEEQTENKLEEEEMWEEEEEIVEEEDEEEFEEEYDGPNADAIRTHPHTMSGRSGTEPSTLHLSDHYFVAPITELLERGNIKHVAEAAEKAFGGKGFPFSTSTPGSKKNLPQNAISLNASQHRMSEVEADAYMAAVMPGAYAGVSSTLVEVRKRLGASWLRKLLLRKGVGPRVMDAGGAGSGAVAWREVAQAEWDIMTEEGIASGDLPLGKTTVLTGSDALRHRVSRFLEDTTFLPRLPDYVHSSISEKHLDGGTPQPRKLYDIILAPHTLLHLKEDFRRKNLVQNLWSLLDPNGGVLILVEKGLPRGFEAVAGARQLLLDQHISSPGDTRIENELQSSLSDIARFEEKDAGMIIAPCTTHNKCPMYLTPGLSFGRKDFCHFRQRFIRPPFLQRVLGATIRNHEDVKFSYLAVRRGVDFRQHNKKLLEGDAATEQAFEGYEEIDLPNSEREGRPPSGVKFNALSLPRAILPALKRCGHVTLDLCTPSGKLERWTVPKSFSRTAYRDARKVQWGDLWALGAKTRVLRTPRLGRLAERGGTKGGKLKGVRDGRMGKGGKKVKKNKFDVVMDSEGFSGIEEDKSQNRFVKRERRTKGGRIWKPKRPIGEDDL